MTSLRLYFEVRLQGNQYLHLPTTPALNVIREMPLTVDGIRLNIHPLFTQWAVEVNK